MRLRHAGIDVAVIALWLGPEQMATANIYLHADMEEKERAIARVTPPDTAPGRYQPPDPLLAFLDSLRTQADPPADDIIAGLFTATQDASAAFRALVVQQDEAADPALQAFLSAQPGPPAWVDPGSSAIAPP